MTDEQTLDEQTSDLDADNQHAEAGSADQRIAELEDQLATAQENALRAAAEAQNIRRRAEQDIEKGPMREGMELTYKLFLDTMKRFQVERLDPQGEPFNPEQQQAMAMEESIHVEPNSVLKVFQCGYAMNGRLLRPAMVVVSKAPSEPPVKIDEQA